MFLCVSVMMQLADDSNCVAAAGLLHLYLHAFVWSALQYIGSADACKGAQGFAADNKDKELKEA